MNKIEYFKAFNEKADQWFKSTPFIEKYHEFFKKFFMKENLAKIEWDDIRQIGDHLHAANSMGMAKMNAFGARPNHPIEFYRNSFNYLAHGAGSAKERLKKFVEDEQYSIKYFGPAIISELAAQVFPEEFVIYNSRSKSALGLLGMEIDRKRGDTKVDEFFKFNDLVKPLVEDYKNNVGQKTKLPINFEIDQFFSFLYENYNNQIDKEEVEEDSDIWTFAPGENAKYIKDAIENGIIHIGWDDLGDLTRYSTVKEIKKALGPNQNGKEQSKNARACFYFVNDLNIGDTVFLRDGRSKIIGKAIIASDYYFDDKRDFHKHCRKIRDFRPLDIKTINLTPMFAIAPLPLDSDLYQEIAKSLTPGESSNDNSTSYFWLNANPKVWNIEAMKVGDSQHYTALNENGQKRRVYDCFEKAQAGDMVIGYSTSPVKKAVCVLQVTSPMKNENGKDVLYFKKVSSFTRQVDLIEMQNDQVIKESTPIVNNQGSLFPLTRDQFEAVISLSQNNEVEIDEEAEYTIETLKKEVFLDDAYIKKMLDILDRKKNIVLQGPPGVGKSFLAKRIASAFIGKKDSKNLRFVQFHQSYSYEEFVQGLRPEEGKSQTFKLKNGIFYELALEAIKNPKSKYVLVIDEINRGNISKIFGELLYLVEGDKRGSSNRINLAYSKGAEDQFYVPENVFIIGTMNTADRSLALVDYALRRRFSFFDIKPSFHNEKFSKWMKSAGISERFISHIVQKITELNKEITENIHELGPGFCIGHSYFQSYNGLIPESEWLEQVLEYDIRPLLGEYWFNEEEKVEKVLKKLMV
jgi:5-methylcytosine-specific restriction protein B